MDKADNPESEVLIYKARTETGEEWSRRINEMWADNRRRLDALESKIQDHRQHQLADTERTRMSNPGKEISNAYDRERRRAQGEDVPPANLGEMVKAKLDAYAVKTQFEGEIKGRYGFLSTPKVEMIARIKSKWWETPDGIAVMNLLRESGGEAADLTKIAKSHSEARAAIARLDA